MGKGRKLALGSAILAVMAGALLVFSSYTATRSATRAGIRNGVIDQSRDWKLFVESCKSEIRIHELSHKRIARAAITAQTKAVAMFIRKVLDDNQWDLPQAAREDLMDRLSRQLVGTTGYVYIFDYEGRYLLSKNRGMDGRDVSGVKDANGNLVVRDLVARGRTQIGSEPVYHTYEWVDPGTTERREKIAALVHFPRLRWVLGVSTYYDELMDIDFRQKTIRHIRRTMARPLGGRTGTGDVWVADGSGAYIVAPGDRSGGGPGSGPPQDADPEADAGAGDFVREAIEKARAQPDGGAYLEYLWTDAASGSSRMKVAGLTYVEGWDWVIGVSGDYDAPVAGGRIPLPIVSMAALALLLGSLVAFSLAIRRGLPPEHSA